MSLLKWGSFISHSGKVLPFKIDCDSLTDEDWECLAKVVATRFSFKKAIGIPSGGIRFANALNRYRKDTSVLTLIVDDVFTTGASFEPYNGSYNVGVVLFARAETPGWIIPVFDLHNMWKIENYDQNEKLEVYK